MSCAGRSPGSARATPPSSLQGVNDLKSRSFSPLEEPRSRQPSSLQKARRRSLTEQVCPRGCRLGAGTCGFYSGLPARSGRRPAGTGFVCLSEPVSHCSQGVSAEACRSPRRPVCVCFRLPPTEAPSLMGSVAPDSRFPVAGHPIAGLRWLSCAPGLPHQAPEAFPLHLSFLPELFCASCHPGRFLELPSRGRCRANWTVRLSRGSDETLGLGPCPAC